MRLQLFSLAFKDSAIPSVDHMKFEMNMTDDSWLNIATRILTSNQSTSKINCPQKFYATQHHAICQSLHGGGPVIWAGGARKYNVWFMNVILLIWIFLYINNNHQSMAATVPQQVEFNTKKCLLFHPTTKCTTPCLMTCSIFKIDVFTFRIISLNVFMRRRPNSQWSNPTCCLFYIDIVMPADVLATLGARASAGMVMIPEPEYSSPASEEISLCGRSQIIAIRIQWASDISRFIVSQ